MRIYTFPRYFVPGKERRTVCPIFSLIENRVLFAGASLSRMAAISLGGLCFSHSHPLEWEEGVSSIESRKAFQNEWKVPKTNQHSLHKIRRREGQKEVGKKTHHRERVGLWIHDFPPQSHQTPGALMGLGYLLRSSTFQSQFRGSGPWITEAGRFWHVFPRAGLEDVLMLIEKDSQWNTRCITWSLHFTFHQMWQDHLC